MPSSRFSKYDGWDDLSDRIEEEEIIDYINHELRTRGIHLSDTDMKQALSDLKDLSNSGTRYGLDVDRFVSMMRKKLDKDEDSNGHQGLQRSRSRFLTLCFVARRLRHDELAKALLRFFTKNQDDIIGGEEPFLLTEWCIGLQQLEDRVPKDKLDEAFHKVVRLGPPLFEQYRRPLRHDRSRERDRLQLIAPCNLAARRLSVPAYQRSLMIEMPLYPHTGYNTPLVSPRICHEVNAFHLQQQVQAFELSRLRRDVDDMIYRY